jgi:hypothetical protein
MTNQTMGHTPTPWNTAQRYQVIRINNNSFRDELIADCKYDDCEFDKNFNLSEANANHIVKCVNSHEELLEQTTKLKSLLKEASQVIIDEWPIESDKGGLIMKINEVINPSTPTTPKQEND